MISIAIALMNLGAAKQADLPTGGAVISMMFAHYSGLPTLTGNIKLVVQAQGPTGTVSEEVDTVLQYARPNRIYIRQDRSAPHSKSWIVSSDGSRFSYNFPEGQGRHAVTDRLVEDVNGMDVSQIFTAASLSLGDRSAPLGIAISATNELRKIAASWPTHDLAGEVEVAGAKVWKVQGQFSSGGSGSKIGDYYLLIGKQGDLLEYATQEKVATPTANGGRDAAHPITLSQTWDVHLEPNGKPLPSLFNLVLHSS